MDINWYGHSCFRLRSPQGVVVTDPYHKEIGLRPPRLKADIVTLSHAHPGHDNRGLCGEEAMIIDGPGEYEAKGIFVIGVAMAHDAHDGSQLGPNTAYCVTMEEVNVCHLGDLGHRPTQAQVEDLGNVDVLLVPVGGQTTIGAAEAAEVVSLIGPAIVVPMHYRSDGRQDLDAVDKFLSEMGATGHEPLDTLRVIAGRLPEEPQVVLLQLRQ